MSMVWDLRHQGYVQGQDFDFCYVPGKWDKMIGEIPRHTDFIFYDKRLATWFSMKYL